MWAELDIIGDKYKNMKGYYKKLILQIFPLRE